MAYSGVTTIKGKKYIWLQEVGYVPAKPIEQFKRGDKIVYNFGRAYPVTGLKKVTKKYYELSVRSPDGKTYKQRVKMGSYKPFK